MMSAFDAVRLELEQAERQWPKMRSAHEGYALILEELDELWAEVQKAQKSCDTRGMRKEAIQVAAMAIRLIKDICDEV